MSMMVLLTGCNTTVFTMTKPDGTKVSISNGRLLWTSDSYSATLTTNGASLSANKSSTDSTAMAAVAQGVIQGMAAAVKP